MPTLRTLLFISFCAVVFQNSGVSQTGSPPKQEQREVLARLSYTSTYVVYGNKEKYLPRVCFELYRDGRYRITRTSTNGGDVNRAGALSQEQFDLIRSMLKKLDFSSRPGGLIRRGSESFVAEVSNAGEEEKRLSWVDPDRQRPFPESVANIIAWLRKFNSDEALPFNVPELSADPVCPRISQTPLQPAGWRKSCQ